MNEQEILEELEKILIGVEQAMSSVDANSFQGQFETFQKNIQRIRRLMEEDRLDVIRTFAATVAHEINSPLTGILGNATMLLHNPEVPGEFRKIAGAISEAGQRVADVVNRLGSIKEYKTKNIGGQKVIDTKKAV